MIRPVKMNLKNFCQHSSLAVEFKPGICGITGRNGSGKSNLIRGLQVAITGDSWDGRSRSDMLKAGTHSGFVELELETESGAATLLRWLSSDKQSLKKSWEADELTRKRDINAWLAERSGAGAGGFAGLEAYRFVPQGGLDRILKMTTIPRSKLLYALFGLDRAEKASAALLEVKQQLLSFVDHGSRLAEAEQELAEREAELNLLKAKESDFATAMTSFESISESLASVASLRRESDRQADLNRVAQLRNNAEARVQALESELATISAELEGGLGGSVVPENILKLRMQMLEAHECPVCSRDITGDSKLEADILEQRVDADMKIAASGKAAEKSRLEAQLASARREAARQDADEARFKQERALPDSEFDTYAEARKTLLKEVADVTTSLQRVIWLEEQVTSLRRSVETLRDDEKTREANASTYDLLDQARSRLHPTDLPKLAFNDILITLNDELERQQERMDLSFRLKFMDDLSFEVDHGTWRSSEHMLSGGQQIMASLSLVLALNKLLSPDLKVMVFDEPTVFLDRNNIKILSTSLAAMADTVKGEGLCMLITTNDPALRPAFGEVIEL